MLLLSMKLLGQLVHWLFRCSVSCGCNILLRPWPSMSSAGKECMQIKHCVWDFHLVCHPLLKTLMLLANTYSHLLTVSYQELHVKRFNLFSCLPINLINTCRFFTTRSWCLRKPWFYDCSLLWRVARTKQRTLPQGCWNYRVHWKKSFTRIHGKGIASKFSIFSLLKKDCALKSYFKLLLIIPGWWTVVLNSNKETI